MWKRVSPTEQTAAEADSGRHHNFSLCPLGTAHENLGFLYQPYNILIYIHIYKWKWNKSENQMYHMSDKSMQFLSWNSHVNSLTYYNTGSYVYMQNIKDRQTQLDVLLCYKFETKNWPSVHKLYFPVTLCQKTNWNLLLKTIPLFYCS